MAWTFKTWISEFKSVDLPIGDLAKDISEDDSFPDEDSVSEIYDHLLRKRAQPQAIDAFIAAWSYYLLSNAVPDSIQQELKSIAIGKAL